ncbi:hypothetical protein G7072_09370 [Nocardioides sp. HDW12B]|uniref:hypothetical protein n=1 Tax=Nocardioides sp. HDW12B TaxID=2714939 RepID=UPI00140C9E2D|nr:hypothetical protein [Nocardioides sp. HDW12B]QIK66533.1 hypothetical protein G7072_09370 [Nocardioides sp. HDW12B]
MRPHLARRWSAALVLPLLWLSACGGSASDAESSDSSSSQGEEAEPSDSGVDLDEPGDDLLSSNRWGGPVPGDTVAGSWRFPESYETTGENVPNNEAESSTGDVDYRLVIGAYPGDDEAVDAADELATNAEEAGQTVEVEEVSIGGRDFVSVTQQDGEDSRRNLFHRPDIGGSLFLVVLEAGEPLDATPQERLDEFVQTAASLEFEAA